MNNAGITIDRAVAKMTDEDWNKVKYGGGLAPSRRAT